MVDLKKLITGFLLLAVLMSSAIFIFSSFSSEKTEVSNLAISAGALKNTGESENPLFENLPEPVGGVADSSPELPPIEDPSNLTDNLAQKMVEEMAKLDPNEGGTVEMGAEKISQEVSLFTENLVSKGMEQDLVSFQKDIEKISNDYRLKNNATTDDVLTYQNTISLVFKDNFSRFSSWDPSGEDIASPTINSLELAIDVAILKTKGMEVPEVFGQFHKSFLEFLAYQKKAIELVKNEEDPLKASLVFQFKEKDFDAVAENFQSEYFKIQSSPVARGIEKDGIIEDFASIFSIKKSHAFLGGMITFDPKNFWKDLKQWAKDTLRETIKKRLIDQMVKQTINWVQGGGKPKFIEDFKGFVAGEADKAVGNEIYKHYPELCSSISPQVRSAFSGIGGIGGQNSSLRTERTKCTLSEVIDNVEEFYTNFGTGGWNSYLEAIKPKNNAFGSIMILSDIASLAKSEEKEAAETSAQASGGLLATRKCTDVKSHNTDELWYLENPGQAGPPTPSSNFSADAGLILKKKGETAVDANGKEILVSKITSANFFGCPQDKWEINTPGTLVGDIVAKSAGAHLDYIIGADSLKALAAALVDSLTTKIIQAGVDGLKSGTVAKKSPKQTLEELKKSCEAFDTSTTEYQDCIDNANEVAKIYESIRIPTSTLLQTANIYRGMFSDAIAANNAFLALRPIFVETLFYELANCTSPQADFVANYNVYMQYITEANSSIIVAMKQNLEASSSIKWLLDFELKVSAATTPDEVDELTQDFENKFDSDAVSFFLQEAVDRKTVLQDRYNGVLKQVAKTMGACTLP